MKKVIFESSLLESIVERRYFLESNEFNLIEDVFNEFMYLSPESDEDEVLEAIPYLIEERREALAEAHGA